MEVQKMYDPDSKKKMTKVEAIQLFRFIYKVKAIQLGYKRGGYCKKN